MKKSKELQVAMKAAKKASQHILGYYNSDKRIQISRKDTLELVTNYDKESEKIIKNILQKNFDYNIVGEESGETNRESEFTWFVDPIDGTTNFIRKFPYFAVSIGLYRKDEALLGIVYNPVYNEWHIAEKGKGAFFNGKKLKVSMVSKLKNSVIATGFCYNIGRELDNDLDVFRRVKHKIQDIRRAGAASLDLCNVASGKFDGFYERGLKKWDIAAGKLIVEEAGGDVTTMNGKEIKTKFNSLCSTNGKIHNALLRLLK